MHNSATLEKWELVEEGDCQSYIIIKRNKIFIFPSDDMIRSTQEVVVQMAISVGEPLFQKPMSSLQLIV